jgi:ketosteroid isomerase-like protein
MTSQEGDVLEFIQKWAQAELNGDGSALKSLLDEEFTAVGPAGFMLSKAQWIDRYESGDLKNEEFAWDVTTVRHYGDTAIVIGVETHKGAYQGRPLPGGDGVRYTAIAARKDGRWLGVGMHLSIMMQPPGAK